MALTAEYVIGCEALPLVSVAGAVPEADIEIETAPVEGERPRFTVRVDGAEPTLAAVEDAFDAAAFVGRYATVVRDGDSRRYTVRPATTMREQLGDRLDDLDDLRALYERPCLVESIRATPAGWIQRARFGDRAAFDDRRRFWQRNDVSFSLRKLTRVGDDADECADGDGGLTDAQRAAVRTAYEMGYFDIPRRASLEDIATELDISASACSERLRRAQTHLVETHVDGADPVARLDR